MPSQIHVGVGVVRAPHLPDRVLACRRRAGGYYGGFWEFPGGKCERDEAPADCVVRELAEELGIVVEIDPTVRLGSFEHLYADRDTIVHLHPFVCRLVAGEPTALQVDDWQWASTDDLQALKFLPANGPLLREVIAKITGVRRR